MMNVYANVKGVFNLLELNWGDIPLPDRGDEINLGGFLTSEDRLNWLNKMQTCSGPIEDTKE